MSSEAQDKYASYNSLARKPLVMGIPIIVLVLGCALMLITAVLGGLVFGIKGLVIPSLILLGLIYVRIRCEKDSRAAEDIKWELKAFLTRIQCQSNTISYTSIDNNPIRRKKHVSEWFKNNTTN